MNEAIAKSFPSLKAYRNDKTGNGAKMTAFLLLETWEAGFHSFSGENVGGQEPVTILEKIRSEQPIFRQILVGEVMSQETVFGKQQVVEMNYRKLFRIAELVSQVDDGSKAAKGGMSSFRDIESHITEIFHFIEEFLSGHLDADRPAPPFLVRQIEGEVFAKLEPGQSNITQHFDGYFDIVSRFLSNLFTETQTPTVRELLYAKQLVAEITAQNVATDANRLRDRLYFLNFNEENFVMAEFERLTRISEAATGKNEKLLALRFEQKRINQRPVMHQDGWAQTMPCLREQVNGWINEEIRFIESGNLLQATTAGVAENTEKIHTSLSVAKLAVIIRLLVIDKIIINRNVSPMLRIVAKLFTTLQRDEISVGSLETKYHAPDKVTVAAVRDMLFKWINILGKL